MGLKIINNKINDNKRFEELNIGDTFIIADEPFMKICSGKFDVKDANEYSMNYNLALRLSDGYICAFETTQMVELSEMELVIKP